MDVFAVVVADADGVIRSWNGSAQDLFGHSAEDAVGRTLDLIVPEAYRERHWTAFRALMAGSDAGLDRGAVSLPAAHRDGSVFRCAVRLVALRDPWDRPAGATAIFSAQQPDIDNLEPLPEL